MSSCPSHLHLVASVSYGLVLLCIDRIVDDLGSAFSMGCLGGTFWHGFKGLKNSPKSARMRGAYNTIILRAPTLGGNFAVWGGLFSAYDCAFIHLRNKEDPFNAIAAGAFTGGTLAARAGLKAIGKNAIIGGVLLAMIEGLSAGLTHMMQPEAPPTIAPAVYSHNAPSALTAPGTNTIGGITPISPLSTSSSSSSSSSLPLTPASMIPSSSSSSSLLLATNPAEEFSTEDFSFDDRKDFEDEL
jgi:import inner membrane translocase subunit TIM17